MMRQVSLPIRERLSVPELGLPRALLWLPVPEGSRCSWAPSASRLMAPCRPLCTTKSATQSSSA